jgi:hypothetical protein
MNTPRTSPRAAELAIPMARCLPSEGAAFFFEGSLEGTPDGNERVQSARGRGMAGGTCGRDTPRGRCDRIDSLRPLPFPIRSSGAASEQPASVRRAIAKAESARPSVIEFMPASSIFFAPHGNSTAFNND